MTTKKCLTRFLALTISIILVAMPLAAQKRKDAQPAPKATARALQEAPTFDNLLAADDYKIYGEIKNVGQLIRSPNVADILDPVIKLAGPPREFKLLVKFANAHAELLTTSRLLFAGWPAKPKLPQALFAIEFPSHDEASKFEPQLREFLPTILPAPTPSSTPAEAGASGKEGRASATTTRKETATTAEKAAEPKPAPLPFAIKLMGNFVLISDTAFNIKDLRAPNSELLYDNLNFRQAHDRFGAEQIFFFFNVALGERPPAESETTTTEISQAQNNSPPAKPCRARSTIRNSNPEKRWINTGDSPAASDVCEVRVKAMPNNRPAPTPRTTPILTLPMPPRW